jgi:hypothetical protein
MQKNTVPARRVMARVLAEDLQKVNGGDGYPPIDLGGGGDPTISEAATSESIPDPRAY